MVQLTNEQITFLKSQGIAPAQLFDASHTKSKADREAQMDALELSLYFGGAACAKGGHTLRTKAGHCIQCDTSKIAYQLRHSASGYVYLAYSQSKKLTKVGFTKNHPRTSGSSTQRTICKCTRLEHQKDGQVRKGCWQKGVCHSLTFGALFEACHIRKVQRPDGRM